MSDIAQPRPEPKRDRWGRYVIGGKPYTRVTTFASSIDDRWNLEAWKVRMAATGLVERADLFAQVAANVGNKKKLDSLCNEAIEAAKGSAGANLGSALHSFTEQIDLGLSPIIPDPWNADIDAYRSTLAANGVRIDPRYVERIVVHHDLGVAGTFDRLVTVDGWPLPVIADLKTGNLEHASAFGAIAVQLACYANAQELYDPVSDSTEPMPPVDVTRALVIHLPAGQAACTLHLVDLTAGWQAAQLCAQVRDWRKRKDLASSFASTLEQRKAWLAARVTRLRDAYPNAFNELARSWPTDVPTFKQSGHTADHLELIALAISNVEARHGVAFPEGSDPTVAKPDTGLVDGLITRITSLPDDLADAVKQAAKAADVPNMQSHRFTVADMALVLDIVADAEAAALSRTSTEVQDNQKQGAAA